MSTFEVLAREQAEERQEENRTILAARVRAQEAFGTFLAHGNRTDRLALIDNDLGTLATIVSDEYGYANIDHVKKATRAFLACTCDSEDCKGCDCTECHKHSSAKISKTCPECEEGEMRKDDHVWTCPKCDYETSESDNDEDEDDEDDDEEGWQKPWEKKANKYIKQRGDKWVIVQKGTGKVLSEHDSEEKANSSFRAMEMHKHADAEDRSEDSFQRERVQLPTADASGLGSEGSPQIDKAKAGDNENWSLEPIDVGSKQHPHSTMDPNEAAGRKEKGFKSPGWDAKSETGTFVDVTTPMQPEMINGPKTQTWTEGQNTPVTNQTITSKYQVVQLGAE